MANHRTVVLFLLCVGVSQFGWVTTIDKLIYYFVYMHTLLPVTNRYSLVNAGTVRPSFVFCFCVINQLIKARGGRKII